MTRPFPSLLLPEFDPQFLIESNSIVAVLEPAGEILWVNPAWQREARANGVGAAVVEGRGSYFEGIGPGLREFYRTVFANAVATNAVFDQIYDCSTPEKRRVFHCRALPVVVGALIVEHTQVVDEELDPVGDTLLAARYADETGRLLQCSHCRRVRGPDPHSWSWMSHWAARPHPRTSHVICPLCADYYWVYAPRGVKRR